MIYRVLKTMPSHLIDEYVQVNQWIQKNRTYRLWFANQYPHYDTYQDNSYSSPFQRSSPSFHIGSEEDEVVRLHSGAQSEVQDELIGLVMGYSVVDTGLLLTEGSYL